jgi:phage terminase Nu1 subunit (DNA packaging protein)
MDEAEFRDLQKAARRERMTVAEWVRQALREARRRAPGRDAAKKLDVVRTAVQHEFPTADIDQMLEEIERGYLQQHAP